MIYQYLLSSLHDAITGADLYIFFRLPCVSFGTKNKEDTLFLCKNEILVSFFARELNMYIYQESLYFSKDLFCQERAKKQEIIIKDGNQRW